MASPWGGLPYEMSIPLLTFPFSTEIFRMGTAKGTGSVEAQESFELESVVDEEKFWQKATSNSSSDDIVHDKCML